MDYKFVKKVTKRRANVLVSPLLNYMKNTDIKNRTTYTRIFNKTQVNDKYVFYESRDGQSMTDNPYAIFKYLLQENQYKDFIHIWSVADKDTLNRLKEEYRGFSNVRFALRMSKDYFYYLSASKFLLNNSTFPNFVTVKEEQIYINTWHGTPLKYMGYDIPGQITGPSNIVRNFLSTDYITSPNPFTTEVFKRAFKLEGLYDGEILEEGYPRMDLTVTMDRQQVIDKLNRFGITVNKEKKTILYAPTWKGDRISQPRDDIHQIVEDMNRVSIRFEDEYQLLIKVHPFLYKFAANDERLKEYLIPDWFDTNELLAATDILITDYSSIFFDYLVTRKPILFYMWDYEDYKSNRGMYIDVDELPGPISQNTDELIEHIDQVEQLMGDFSERYDKFNKLFCNNNYGEVTKTIVNRIFGQRSINPEKSQIQQKERILIYPGGFRNNGITGAMISLLDNIDYEKYDVTLFVNITNNAEALNNMKRVNGNVRFVFKIGRIGQTIGESYRNYLSKNRGLTTPFLEKIYPADMFKREFKRLFGKAKFDYIIDYSGYSMFWPSILLGGKAKKKLIFMHSDLYEDMHKVINGRRPHYINLRGVFSLYKFFDGLVSVSEATMKLNQSKLQKYIGNKEINYVINSITPQKIIEMSKDESEVYQKNGEPVLVKLSQPSKNRYDIVNIPIPYQEDGYVNFINMGRLSPEKGQERLIEAFAAVHEKYPNTRLYIVGEGSSRTILQKLINQFNLGENVILTGHLSNPFYLMSKCDAFVLSSYYEGQPLVLLESLTLNLSTIATDIVANRYVLENGKYGTLVEDSADGLIEGMLKVCIGDEKKADFDAEEYNDRAMESFYKLLK